MILIGGKVLGNIIRIIILCFLPFLYIRLLVNITIDHVISYHIKYKSEPLDKLKEKYRANIYFTIVCIHMDAMDVLPLYRRIYL